MHPSNRRPDEPSVGSVLNRILDEKGLHGINGPSASKPHALFIVAHAPSAAARQAGHKTAQMHLDKLKLAYAVDTIICCSATPDELANAARCASTIKIIAIDRVLKAMCVFKGMLRGIPPRFSTRFLQQLARPVAALVRDRNYQLVWLEYSQVFWLLPVIKKAADDSLGIVMSIHDVQTELVGRKSRLERTLFGAWTRAYERRVLRRGDTVAVPSAKDGDLVTRLCGPAVKIMISHPPLSDFVHRVIRRDEQVKPHSLLMWGAMNRTENSASVLWFHRHIFPSIIQRFPDAMLFIVGANPPRQLQAIASDHVIITGFIDDPTPYFVQASLGVVPLTEGAGIKLKTLEMLASGLTVVSTAIGAEGIPKSDKLIVTDMRGMPDVIIGLLAHSTGGARSSAALHTSRN